MERETLPLGTGFGRIRYATPSDVTRIVEMVGSLSAHHGDTPALSEAVLIRDLFDDIPWIYALVAETGNGLVGYAILQRLTRLHFGLRGMTIHHLYTEAGMRGTGVGRQMIDACTIASRAHGCSYLTVGTHPDNVAAQAFYEGVGFARADAHPPYFSKQI